MERAGQHGVKLADSEFSNNVLGDLGVLAVRECEGTPALERRTNVARRFSTPLSGKAQKDMETSGVSQSPIPSSLSRVLSFPV